MGIGVSVLLDRLLPPFLVGLHAVLLGWAAVGLVEWLASDVPWPAVANELFPRWLLLPHWLAVLGASAVFLVGYVRRWPGTPLLLIPAYGFMAVVCAVETLYFLTHPLRHVAMMLEFAAYVLIPVALYRAPSLVRHFRLAEELRRPA